MPLDERLAVYDFMIREQTTVLGRVVDYLVEQYGRERGSLRGMLPFIGRDERDKAMSLAWIVGQTFAASHMMMTSDEWFGMAMTGGLLEFGMAPAKVRAWDRVAAEAAQIGQKAGESLQPGSDGWGRDSPVTGRGNVSVKVNQGQQDKHIPGTNNYRQEEAKGNHRSILLENPQRLLDSHAGRGVRLSSGRERVDFGRIIGQFYDRNIGRYIDTTRGIIHYDSRGNAHIVPAAPRGYR